MDPGNKSRDDTLSVARARLSWGGLAASLTNHVPKIISYTK
jgi:hypothetical protein